MKSTKMIFILVILLVITSVYLSIKNPKDAVEDSDVVENIVIDTTDIDQTGETDSMMEDGVMPGTYEAYDPEKLAFAETGNVVLFFRASWCSTCRTLDEDIKANMANIPSDLRILDVDYDNSTDLKKKYQVTTQHTLVQVDKDGNMLKKWIGSADLVDLASKVQ